MGEIKYITKQYRLRAGSPMPIAGGGYGHFVLHTFMAETSDIEMILCTEDLPSTDEFRGQGGSLISASFSRMNIAGGKKFQGKRVYDQVYIEEDALGFNF